jgi:uncharacterized membrane protein YqjE
MTVPYSTNSQHGDQEQQGIGELISTITSDLSRLFQQEVELAKAEMKVEAKKAGKAGAMFGAAGLAGLMVIILISFAIVYALDAIMPQGWAALIVAVVWGIIGAVLYLRGRKEMATVDPVPHQTVDTLKEDAQWARNPTR